VTAIAAGFLVLLLPYSIIGPFAGALLDRWDRHRGGDRRESGNGERHVFLCRRHDHVSRSILLAFELHLRHHRRSERR